MQFDKLPAAQVSSTEPIWLEKLPFLVNENYTCKRLSVQKWGVLIFILKWLQAVEWASNAFLSNMQMRSFFSSNDWVQIKITYSIFW